jgi:YD repeat-containing protein
MLSERYYADVQNGSMGADTPATNITTITDPVGNVTKHVYDNDLRIVQIINAQGGTSSFAYDSNNNKTAITNANTETTP